jgi:hypothetical protein
MLTKRTIDTSEATLYAIAAMAIKNLEEDLTDFAKFSPSYSAELIDELKAKLKAAKDIPSGKRRTTNQKLERERLESVLNLAKEKWMTLCIYINKTYKDETLKIMLNDAGIGYKDDKVLGYWDRNAEMLEAGAKFLEEKKGELIASKAMNASFVDEYKTAFDAFEETRLGYMGEVKDTDQMKSENNAINGEIRAMLSVVFTDAKVVFKKDGDKRVVYTWAYLKRLVKGNAKSTVKTEEPASGGVASGKVEESASK